MALLTPFWRCCVLENETGDLRWKSWKKMSEMMLSSRSKWHDDGGLTVKWQVIARIRYADEEGRGKTGQDVEEGSKVFMGRSGGAKAGWWGRCTAKNFSATKVGQALKFWPSSEFHAAPCRPAPRSGFPSRFPNTTLAQCHNLEHGANFRGHHVWIVSGRLFICPILLFTLNRRKSSLQNTINCFVLCAMPSATKLPLQILKRPLLRRPGNR